MSLNLPIKRYERIERFFSNPAKNKLLLKGRRAGATISMAYWIIEKMLTLEHFRGLWVDVGYAEIRMYWAEYFEPILNLLPKKMDGRKVWDVDRRDNWIDINGNRLIFKSASNPKSIEGGRYTHIFVNECGYLLKTDQLLNGSLLPMLSDFDGDSCLVGTPQFGSTSYHYSLAEQIKSGEKSGWHIDRLTTYDNPYLQESVIRAWEKEMGEKISKKNIYGFFPEESDFGFYYNFSAKKHVKNLSDLRDSAQKGLAPIMLSFDFNLDPCVCLVCVMMPNQKLQVLENIYVTERRGGAIEALCRKFAEKYPTENIRAITGDASGRNSNANYDKDFTPYARIARLLTIPSDKFRVPKMNLSHDDVSSFINVAFARDMIEVDESCTMLIRDLAQVGVLPKDGGGVSIDKRDKRLTHASDALNYAARYVFQNLGRSWADVLGTPKRPYDLRVGDPANLGRA